jgi:hypothetical protein
MQLSNKLSSNKLNHEWKKDDYDGCIYIDEMGMSTYFPKYAMVSIS